MHKIKKSKALFQNKIMIILTLLSPQKLNQTKKIILLDLDKVL